jgi:hypothetical protein
MLGKPGEYPNTELVVLGKLGTRGRGVLIVFEWRYADGKQIIASWAPPATIVDQLDLAHMWLTRGKPFLTNGHWTEIVVKPCGPPKEFGEVLEADGTALILTGGEIAQRD